MSEPAVIQVNKLICQAGTKTMLDMAHWSVTAGERIAIVGHNGAGKSTLLRCLGGFVHPSRGNAVVLGRQLGPHTPPKALRQLRVEVGQVMQGLHLVQRVSALDNVLMGVLGRRSGWRTWVRMHAAADVASAEAALSDVGLLSKADERVDRLSGGERPSGRRDYFFSIRSISALARVSSSRSRSRWSVSLMRCSMSVAIGT